MTIVIVDDSVTTLIVLKQMAKSMGGLPVTTFSVPNDALDYLARNPAHLVVVDCEMPDINGVDFIRAVRGSPQHRMTPIVMVTQHSDVDLRECALQAGATDFLSKPVNAAEFKLRLRNLLNLSGRELAISV